MKRKKLFSWVGLGILAIVLGMQLIRPKKNIQKEASPADLTAMVPTSPEVKKILETSCYDCHSNTTRYPWYAEIMPVGWWINHHVEEGKGELNFSEAGNYKLKKLDHKLEEVDEQVRGGEMPPKDYLNLHKDAKLTAEQVDMLGKWAMDARAYLRSETRKDTMAIVPQEGSGVQ